MAFFDKLSQRGLNRLNRTPKLQEQQISPLPSITDNLNKPSANVSVKPQTGLNRLGQLPQRGTLGTVNSNISQRFVADLPANMQLQGINRILAGESINPQIDEFVKTLAAQGKTPEEIRQAFIAQEKNSPNPLIIL